MEFGEFPGLPCKDTGHGAPRLGARGAPQARQLASGLRLIRDDLENAEVLLRRGGPVPGLGGAARQAEPFIYQQIAERANVLRRRGMSASSIARRLGMSDKTVTKALRRFEKNTQSMPRS